MPKVLRIINRFNLGGPTYNAGLLTKYLAPEFETLLVGGQREESENDSEHILHDLELEPTYLKHLQREISFREDRAAYREVIRLIEEFKPDIVHTHASKAGAVGRLAAHKMKVPVIVHTFHGHVFHSYFGRLKTNFYKNVERYLARRSSRIIAISEIQKQELAEQHKIAPASKIEVIPLGFDLSRFSNNQETKRKAFRDKFKVNDSDIAISIIGRLVPIKNHKLFIESIAKLPSENIRAFIVGDGESRQELKAFCRDLNVDYSEGDRRSTITFTSWIKEVDEVLAGSDIVALTSLNEGTPVTLIEAQAASKPIVTTDVGGIRDIVIPGETALISSSDPEQFSSNLNKLIESKDLRQKLSQKGEEFVNRKFNYSRLAEDMSRLYNELLGSAQNK